MTINLPAATADRTDWTDLPATVRNAIANRLSADVVAAATQHGGFTSGVAARLRLADGTAAFVKAIAARNPLAAAYRREARTAAALPLHAPAPTLIATMEVYGWIVLLFDDVDGHHPNLTHPTDLTAVLACADELITTLSAFPTDTVPRMIHTLGTRLTGWRILAANPPSDLDAWTTRHLARLADTEANTLTLFDGDALLHLDLRPDNILITNNRALAVDWASAALGAPWIDLTHLLITAHHASPDAVAAVTDALHARDAPTAGIDGYLIAITGYWAYQSRQPAPPRAPFLRRYQARQAAAGQQLLAHRGWS